MDGSIGERERERGERREERGQRPTRDARSAVQEIAFRDFVQIAAHVLSFAYGTARSRKKNHPSLSLSFSTITRYLLFSSFEGRASVSILLVVYREKTEC